MVLIYLSTAGMALKRALFPLGWQVRSLADADRWTGIPSIGQMAQCRITYAFASYAVDSDRLERGQLHEGQKRRGRPSLA
jgi:hypothetical protein